MIFYRRFSLLLALLVSPSLCLAGLVSGNLTEPDRREVLKTLGYSSSLKILADPYPLGGYSGFEIGLSIESVPTKDFKLLGDGSAGGELLVYPVVSMGKGLYENLDIFVNFSFFGPENRVGVYGGLIRWGFFESETMPLTASFTIQSASNNFDNQITGEVASLNLNLGLNFTDSSFYLGLGKINTKADFAKELTSTAVKESLSAEDTQIKLGAVYHFRPYFVAVEFNRYFISHWSAKVGLRF